MADLTYAEGLAKSLPICDEDSESDLISLCDIVVTGIETPFNNFGVLFYRPKNDGIKQPWATLVAYKSAGLGEVQRDLYASTVREATQNYLQSRLDGGMDPAEAAKLIDGSYTDAMIADSILQFAIYGEEVFN